MAEGSNIALVLKSERATGTADDTLALSALSVVAPVNLAVALVFWWALRSAKNAGMAIGYFLLITCAFNLFTGTGYFCLLR